MMSYSSPTKEIMKRAAQIPDSNYEHDDLGVILHELPLDVQQGYYLVNDQTNILLPLDPEDNDENLMFLDQENSNQNNNHQFVEGIFKFSGQNTPVCSPNLNRKYLNNEDNADNLANPESGNSSKNSLEGDEMLIDSENYEPESEMSSDSRLDGNDVLEEPPVNKKIRENRRWKNAKPETWKKTITKDRMSKCLTYSNKKGKVNAAKIPQKISCEKCKFKCTTKFSDEKRVEICKEYWGLEKYERKLDLILKLVEVSSPKTRRPRKGANSCQKN